MAVRLAQASADERGAYSGGMAGNQSGSELNIRVWYNRPWDTVLRAKNYSIAVAIADVAQRLVKCMLIGYDQYQRTTLWDECEKINWDINRINQITPCECDCSALVAVVLRFCGISIPKTTYTGSLTSAALATGQFECLRDPKYLTSDTYLQKGDIVLNTAHHVSIALDSGTMAAVSPAATAGSKKTNYAAQVKVSDYLNVRTGPGTNYPICKDPREGKEMILLNGTVIAILEELNGWGRVNDISGWISLSYVRRIN